jgi:hypothetical protein
MTNETDFKQDSQRPSGHLEPLVGLQKPLRKKSRQGFTGARQYSLLCDQSRLIGVIALNGWGNSRKDVSWMSGGMKAILNELRWQWEATTVEEMDKYEVCLLSLTSQTDMCTAALRLPEKHVCKIIVGGSGCTNIRSIIPMIDVACFGRCEGMINEIVEGGVFENVWRKETDPNFTGQYVMRQAQYLVSGEVSVGCKFRCRFCQYTWTRKLKGETYHHGKDLATYEDNFVDLQIEAPGHHTSAIDGTSERSRFLVGKPIPDELIIEKIQSIQGKHLLSTVTIKLYNIIGYPWETRESIEADMIDFGLLLKRADTHKGTRILIMMMITPFSPEPLTPMSMLQAETRWYWREEINLLSRNLYKSDTLEAFILPQINSNKTLLMRCLTNRGASAETIRQIEKSGKNGGDWKEWAKEIEDKWGTLMYTGIVSNDPCANIKTWTPLKYCPPNFGK